MAKRGTTHPEKSTSSDESSTSEYVSNQTTPKEKGTFFVKPWGPNYRHRLALSYKRFWWLKLLITAAIVLVITLPLIFVLYPKLSQQGIDQTIVTVQGLGLSGPTPDSYLFSINSTLYPQTSFKVNLAPFNVSLYLTDYDLETPFTTVLFPAIYVAHETTVNITNQLVQIENFTAWEKYLQVAFSESSYRVTTLGKPHLHLGALPTNQVNYNKTLEISGFGGLTNITTTNLTVILGKDVIYDFYATANVQNPSASTVVVGDITYDTYVAPNDTFIGQTFLTDVVLGPGANVFDFKSSTSQLPVVQALATEPYCQTGDIDVRIVPKNVTFNGLYVPWLMPQLVNVSQTLNIVPAIDVATNNTFKVTCPSNSTA